MDPEFALHVLRQLTATLEHNKQLQAAKELLAKERETFQSRISALEEECMQSRILVSNRSQIQLIEHYENEKTELEQNFKANVASLRVELNRTSDELKITQAQKQEFMEKHERALEDKRMLEVELERSRSDYQRFRIEAEVEVNSLKVSLEQQQGEFLVCKVEASRAHDEIKINSLKSLVADLRAQYDNMICENSRLADLVRSQDFELKTSREKILTFAKSVSTYSEQASQTDVEPNNSDQIPQQGSRDLAKPVGGSREQGTQTAAIPAVVQVAAVPSVNADRQIHPATGTQTQVKTTPPEPNKASPTSPQNSTKAGSAKPKAASNRNEGILKIKIISRPWPPSRQDIFLSVPGVNVPKDVEAINALLPRLHVSTCLGGGRQSLIADVAKNKPSTPMALAHGTKHLIFPKRDLNCWLPQKPGDHGYMFVGLQGPAKDSEKFSEPEMRTLFIAGETSDWQYFGKYECHREVALTPEEWSTFSEEFKRGYAECTLSKRMGGKKFDDFKRAHSKKDDESNQFKAQIGEIRQDYDTGKLRVPCISLKCSGYDQELVLDLLNALGTTPLKTVLMKRKRTDKSPSKRDSSTSSASLIHDDCSASSKRQRKPSNKLLEAANTAAGIASGSQLPTPRKQLSRVCGIRTTDVTMSYHEEDISDEASELSSDDDDMYADPDDD